MILEDQRFLHEDIERLEQAISDRILDDPSTHRERLRKEHQLAKYLSRIETQSRKLLRIYADDDGARASELDCLATGDNFDPFYSQLSEIKEFHRRYPNERVENLELTYRKPGPGEPVPVDSFVDVEHMFTGEESFGKFLDLTTLHERYLNLPGVKGGRRVSYLQYLDLFDIFTGTKCPIKRHDKVKDVYFQYVTDLADYLESFIQRTRPLENLEAVFSQWEKEFLDSWKEGKVEGWTAGPTSSTEQSEDVDMTQDGPASDPLWCKACQKRFANQNLFDHHLTGKKHKRAAAQLESSVSSSDAAATSTPQPSASNATNPSSSSSSDMPSIQASKLKEEAIAHREFRVRKLANAMSVVRDDTKVNVERKQVLTERERQQELAVVQAEMADVPVRILTAPGPLASSVAGAGAGIGVGGTLLTGGGIILPNGFAAGSGRGRDGGGGGGGGKNNRNGTNQDDDSDDEERIYNPLKLPLAWDGKPIPYWLYKLHGLGVEFPCEICGNFVYMGRRAFDKHFNEARHLSGLKCLGVTDTTLFREVVRIDDALKLQEKIMRNKKSQKSTDESVVQMEDAEGNVMPEKVYYDLQKQGLL